jgi:hypothetical protein
MKNGYISGMVGVGNSWGNVVEQYYTEYVGLPTQNMIKYSNNAIANNNYIYYQNIFK